MFTLRYSGSISFSIYGKRKENVETSSNNDWLIANILLMLPVF